MGLKKSYTDSQKSWKGLITYELYPQSFKDSNGDGIGDLEGIRQKLDYIKKLGIDAIWFTPFFPSPLKDNGYDVSDYEAIDPRFGDLKTADKLFEEIHTAGMKIILDLVLNHTSDMHPWFEESRSSHNNPKNDWYIWHDPKPDGSEPNNWVSHFGGPAWTFDKKRGQYYHHSFLPEQPDLNYRNPQAVKAIDDIIRFWFDRGIDGLRLDAFPNVAKYKGMPDEPVNPNYKKGKSPYTRLTHPYARYQPEMFALLEHFCNLVKKEYPGKILISESYPSEDDDIAVVRRLYEAGDPTAHTPFNFAPIRTRWNLKDISQMTEDTYKAKKKDEMLMWTLGNHDVPRLATRIGTIHTRIAAMWLLTMPSSMPVMYYGDEIGMKDQKIPTELQKDVFLRFNPASKQTRDSARLPMPWNNEEKAGFTTGTPWLPTANNYRENNVASQEKDPHSLLNLYKTLIKHRKNSQAIIDGAYGVLQSGNEHVYAYQCIGTDENELVLLNFSNKPQRVNIPDVAARIILNTTLQRKKGDKVSLRSFILNPNEGILLKL